jgi:hypothetical protein
MARFFAKWDRALAGAAVLVAGMGGSALAEPTVTEFDSNGGKWSVAIGSRPAADTGIVITPAVALNQAQDQAPAGEPGPKITPAIPAPVQEPPAIAEGTDPLALSARYAAVYSSIPYSRALYEANPSYRHDATMELLLGELRPTVIQRHEAAPAAPAPFSPYPAPYSSPYLSPYAAPCLAPYTAPYLAPYGCGPAPWSNPYPFGYFDLSRGQYSLYQRLFGYEGGWRTQFNINGGYGDPRAIWW